MKVNLWKIDGTTDTTLARYYSKLPPSRNPQPEDFIYVPKSIIEGVSQNLGGHHVVELPDWFVRKEGL